MSSYLLNYIASLLVTFMTTSGMAVFVWMHGWEIPANRRFVLFNLSVAWWSFFQMSLALVSSYEMACWVSGLEHVSVVFISTLFLHFVYDLLGLKSRFWLKFHYALSFLFLALIPSGLLLNGVDTQHRWLPFMIEPGPLYPAMMGWFLVESAQGVGALLRAYLKSSGADRNRMMYLAWGALIGYLGGCGNYLYVFDREIFLFNPFGTYGVALYVAMTAYAIIRHRLMDIKVVIQKTVIYALLYSLCLAVFGFVVFFLGQWVLLGGVNPRLVLLSMVGLLLVVAVMHPLDRFLTHLTKKVLFRERYRYQETLKAASAGMSRIRNLPKLLELTARVVVSNVKVTHATIFLKDKNQPFFAVAASHGRSAKPVVPGRLEENNALIRWMEHFKEPMVYEELSLDIKKDPHAAEEPPNAPLGQVVREMERLDAAVCVPSLMEEKLKGFLVLGRKLSGDMYDQEDLDIFSTLASQSALAVENAEAYEEIRNTRNQLLLSERLATIGQFAANMAHEIKNPLQAILTFFEYLPERHNDSEFRDRFSNLAKSEIERISRLVKELATYTNPKPPKFQPVEIQQVLESVLELLYNDFLEQGIIVRRNYDPKEPMVEADRDQLTQVFLNLMMNAMEAMPMDGSREDLLEIIVSTRVEDVSVVIKDAGVGIPESQIPTLFTPSFTSTKEKGTGLGLAIVHNIVTAHHGRITVRSQVGVGTSITVSIPYSQPSAPEISKLAS